MLFDIKYVFIIFAAALKGVPATLLVTIVTFFVGMFVGLILAIVRANRVPVLNRIVAAYVSIIRGVPIIIQIFLIFNTLPRVIFAVTQDPRAYNIPPIIYAFAVYWLTYSALFSEIFRSAIISIPAGQLEAAHSVGMTTSQAYRRILLPQMLTNSLPNIWNLALNLIKGTSLVYMMSILDITAYAKIAAAGNMRYLEAYVVIFIFYQFLCFVTGCIFRLLEQRLRVYQAV